MKLPVAIQRFVPGAALARFRLPLNPFGFADQAFISAANFATTILLARNLSPAAFGTVTLLFGVLFFLGTIQAAVVTQPHHAFGAIRAGDDYARYTVQAATLQAMLAACFAVALLAAAAVADLLGQGFAPLLLGFLPLIVAWQLQEFVRRCFYTHGDIRSAIGNDLLSYGGQVIGLFVLARTGTFTAGTAIAVLTASSLAAFLVGLVQLREHWSVRLHAADIGEALREHWRFGRWLLGGSLLTWMAGGYYVVLTLAGVVAAGAYRALEVFLGPVQVLIAGMDGLVPPAAARLYAAGGGSALRRFLGRILTLLVPVVAGYGLLVSFLADRLIPIVYGDAYRSYHWLVPLMAVSSLLAICHQPAALTLRGIGRTSLIFRAQAAAVAISAPLGIGIALYAGVIGAAIGTIAHFLVLNAVLWPALLGRLSPEPPVSAPMLPPPAGRLGTLPIRRGRRAIVSGSTNQ